MKRLLVVMAVITPVVAAGAWALEGADEPSAPAASTRVAAVGTPEAREAPVRARFGGALEHCASRSEADFPGAFTNPRNLVVGPLVLVGAAYTDPETVREFGGNKFPLLVEAGHVVTVRLARPAPTWVGLAYGPLPQGEGKLEDTYRSVTFAACRPGRPTGEYSPDGPSGSEADGRPVTFWSGFVLTRRPACIPLDVYVDDDPPRRVGLALGRRCSA